MPRLLKNYLNRMSRAQNIEEFKKYDCLFIERYNTLLKDDDIDLGRMTDKYLKTISRKRDILRKK